MLTIHAISDSQLEDLISRIERKRSQRHWYVAMKMGWIKDRLVIESMKRHAPPFMIGGYEYERLNAKA